MKKKTAAAPEPRDAQISFQDTASTKEALESAREKKAQHLDYGDGDFRSVAQEKGFLK